MTEPVRILGICGSLRDDSITRRAMRLVLESAAAAGAHVDEYDISMRPLPFCYGDETPEQAANREAFVRMVTEADGLLLTTPEYHGSFSGILKNALDLVGFQEMEGKVCGLLSVLGGQSTNNALNHLRVVCRHVHAWVLPGQVAIPNASRCFAPDGSVADPKLQARLERLGRELAEYSARLRGKSLA